MGHKEFSTFIDPSPANSTLISAESGLEELGPNLVVIRETSPRSEFEGLSRSIVTDLTGYDLWLQEHGQFIVDMYITKPEDLASITPIDQTEALSRFKKHIAEIEEIGFGRLPPEWALIRANLNSVVTYVEEKERVKSGETKMPYREYLIKVSGIRPRYIPPEELGVNRKEVLRGLLGMGFQFDENDGESISAAFRKYYQVNPRLSTKSSIETNFQRFDNRHRYQLSQVLGENLRDVNFDIVWEEQDEFWMMWERVLYNRNLLRANFHRRQRNNWDIGATERYAIHEPAHFVFAHLVGQEIEKGNLDPAVGIFPIPSPACFQLEGLAQTVDDLASLDVTPDGKLSIAKYRLEKRALANGLYEVESGRAIPQVAQGLRQYMPLKSPEEISQLLIEGTEKPFERAYLPIYGLSDYDLLQLNEKLGNGMRSVFLQQIFRRPMTRDQLMNPTFHLENLIPYGSE